MSVIARHGHYKHIVLIWITRDAIAAGGRGRWRPVALGQRRRAMIEPRAPPRTAQLRAVSIAALPRGGGSGGFRVCRYGDQASLVSTSKDIHGRPHVRRGHGLSGARLPVRPRHYDRQPAPYVRPCADGASPLAEERDDGRVRALARRRRLARRAVTVSYRGARVRGGAARLPLEGRVCRGAHRRQIYQTANKRRGEQCDTSECRGRVLSPRCALRTRPKSEGGEVESAETPHFRTVRRHHARSCCLSPKEQGLGFPGRLVRSPWRCGGTFRTVSCAWWCGSTATCVELTGPSGQ